jgi:hypothetical protein
MISSPNEERRKVNQRHAREKSAFISSVLNPSTDDHNDLEFDSIGVKPNIEVESLKSNELIEESKEKPIPSHISDIAQRGINRLVKKTKVGDQDKILWNLEPQDMLIESKSGLSGFFL